MMRSMFLETFRKLVNFNFQLNFKLKINFLKCSRLKKLSLELVTVHNNHYKEAMFKCMKHATGSFKKHEITFEPKLYFLLAISLPFFDLKQSEKEKDDNDEIIHTMKLAVLAQQKEDYEKSERLLHLALKMAQEVDNKQAITYIYDLMANFALSHGELDKAEQLFISVLKNFIRDGMSPEDNAIVDVSLKLATIHSQKGENDKAVTAFQFCIETQENKLKELGDNADEDTLVLWAMSHDWFARFLMKLRHYDKAQDHFNRALEMCLKMNGREHPQTAVLYNDIGSVCSMQQHYDEAIKNLLEAIEIGESLNFEDLSAFYVNLGTIYMQKSIFDEAENWFKKAESLAKKDSNDEALKESKTCLETLKELRTR